MPVSTMQRGAAVPPGRRHERVPFGELGEAADHRVEVVADVGGRGPGQDAVEHVDRGARRHAAQAPPLRQVPDEERLAARAHERGRHRLEAAAIGVRLDHGGALGGRRAVGQLAPVGDDRVEVDRQDAAGLRLGGLGRLRRPDGFRSGHGSHLYT